jgi:hypothetical protein
MASVVRTALGVLLLALGSCSPEYPEGEEREVRPECGSGDGALGAFCCAADECESGQCRDAACTRPCTANEDCGPCDSRGCPNLCLVADDEGLCYRDCAVHPEICEGDTECHLASEMPGLDSQNNTNFENTDAERVACFRLAPEE